MRGIERLRAFRQQEIPGASECVRVLDPDGHAAAARNPVHGRIAAEDPAADAQGYGVPRVAGVSSA